MTKRRLVIDDGLSSPGGATGVGNYSDTLYQSLLEKTRDNGDWEIKYRNYSKLYLLPRKLRRLSYLFWINSLGQLGGKDIIHFTNYYSPLLKIGRAKQVVNIHDMAVWHIPGMYDPVFVRLMKAVIVDAAKKSDMIITFTDMMKQDIVNKLGVASEKIEVIYHAVKPLYRFLNIPRENFILYVGNIDKNKNIPTLVKAFARLRKNPEFTALKLIIVGKKREGFSDVQKLIEQEKLQDKIEIPGFLTDEKILDLYNRAMCVIMPSFYEGFGIPIIESMACGTPIVVSDIAVFREAIGDAGLIYGKPDDFEALHTILQKLLESKDLQLALREKGLKQAQKFSTESSARRHLEIYSQLLGA